MNPQNNQPPNSPEPPQPVAPPDSAAPVASPQPATSDPNIPGHMQAKIDAHPLFSGNTDPNAPKLGKSRRKLWLGLLTLFLAVIVGLYLAVDAGAIRGASHLPFHIFKQKEAFTPVTPKPLPSQPTTTPTTSDSYVGWKTYTVPVGKYSFKYHPKWGVSSGGLYTPGAAFITEDGSRASTEGPIRMALQSHAGNTQADNYGLEGISLGDRVDKSEVVTINGVGGKRIEITATHEAAMTPPVMGEKDIVYVFYTQGRTFSYYYSQEPSQKDISADFELMVKSVTYIK